MNRESFIAHKDHCHRNMQIVVDFQKRESDDINVENIEDLNKKIVDQAWN